MVNGSSLDGVFAALADPTRRRIVERLARGPLTVGEIASGFSISQPAISRHVRVLEECGLLERRISGRVHECRLAPQAIDAAAAWIDKQRAFWSATLDRLADVLEAPPPRKKRKP
jgi:DNA-binding transcriptional ArsR family regulator